MAIIKKGSIPEFYSDGVAIQPGYSLTEKNDGTIEGTVVFECDISSFANLPGMGASHPRDGRCEIYNKDTTYLGLQKVQMTASYFGLVSKKTNPIISYSPNTNKEAIETHPDFIQFAGTKDAPNTANGAKFDDDTGAFLGFFTPSVKQLFGVTGYLVPATMVSLTYWQSSVPSLSKQMTIRNSIPGFKAPPGVKNFLLLDIPYRQLGSFYQVTEQYLGSGPNGWSTILYP